jgi:hypothetical protein
MSQNPPGYDREYNRTHPERNRRASRKAIDRNKAVVIAAKSQSCVDCGKSYHHTVMDFDHLPGCDKKFRLAAHKHCGLEKLQQELDKCEPVCANCHRVRTWNRSHPEDQIFRRRYD